MEASVLSVFFNFGTNLSVGAPVFSNLLFSFISCFNRSFNESTSIRRFVFARLVYSIFLCSYVNYRLKNSLYSLNLPISSLRNRK